MIGHYIYIEVFVAKLITTGLLLVVEQVNEVIYLPLRILEMYDPIDN